METRNVETAANYILRQLLGVVRVARYRFQSRGMLRNMSLQEKTILIDTQRFKV